MHVLVAEAKRVTSSVARSGGLRPLADAGGRRAGVFRICPVTWIVDLEADEVVAAEDPSAQGYLRVQTLHRGAVLRLGSVPGLEISVEEALGPHL